MMRCGIDPGKHACAFAVSEGRDIVSVEYGKIFRGKDAFDELYLEVPRVYPGFRKEDPNDLVQVARGLGIAEGSVYADKVIELAPRDWKGTIDGDIMLRRIESRLTPQELALVNALKLPKKTRHNALDAVGILLWAMGRL